MKRYFIRKGCQTIVFLLLCSTFFSLIGCWDRREVNDIAIVLTTGIDYKDEKEIELSVEMVMPEEMAGKIKEGGGGSGTRTTFIESATGITVADARSKLQEKISRYLFWGHAEATVIGEQLAEKGIREHVDFFARMAEARLRNQVFVSKGKAKDLISSLPHLEDSATQTIQELSQFQIGMNVTMSKLMQMLKSETGGAALPMIDSTSSKKEPGKLPDKSQLKLMGTAVFKEDKMIGSLDSEVTRGLLWLRDEIRYATITLDVPEGEGKVTMEMIRSETELIPHLENDKWKITVKIKTEDDVIQNASNLDLRNPEFIMLIEKEIEKEVEERIKLAVEKVQKDMKVDILKFDSTFQREYKKKWQTAKERWAEIFPEIEIEFVVDPHILRPGGSTGPPAVPKNEVKQK
ncbi:Ger(x)C family spore germination protein [Alkalihalobacillus sp. BA299]|uniref:Ger(x)C family spore germination protein n=1 Tax=Alkalihalobacillus sp. BA299 TaxID=2815938 RepID=UPI001ADA2042|nr:Ger(x)C family spore germination protein [Alkalihalobacillus sp. BA299]